MCVGCWSAVNCGIGQFSDWKDKSGGGCVGGGGGGNCVGPFACQEGGGGGGLSGGSFVRAIVAASLALKLSR